MSPAATQSPDDWDDPPKPWERQQGETVKAFAAFTTWRDLGPERSIQKAATALGKSRQLLVAWASEHRWRPRIDAWERELDRQATSAQLKAVEEMATRHTRGALLLFNAATQRAQQLSENPDQISPRDVARMFATAVDVERKSRGEPERLEVGLGGDAETQSAVASFIATIGAMGANLRAPIFSPIPAGTEDEEADDAE